MSNSDVLPEQRLSRKKPLLTRLTPYLFISPWVIGFLAFTLGPMLFSLIISFFDWPIIGDPSFVGMENYKVMFTQDPFFWHSLKVTFKFALYFVPLNIIIALGLAMLLNTNARFMGIFRTIFYLPSVISGVALAMIWAWVYSKDYGILNYFLSLIGVTGPDWLGDKSWAIIAMCIASLWTQGTLVMIFLAGLKNIPYELYEAATLDGAGELSKFLHITLPMLSPTMLFNLITTLIGAFQQLTIPLLLTRGGPANETYFFAMFVYDNAFKYFKMGYAAANAWFMFFIVLLLTALVFKSGNMWVYYEAEVAKTKKVKKGWLKK